MTTRMSVVSFLESAVELCSSLSSLANLADRCDSCNEQSESRSDLCETVEPVWEWFAAALHAALLLFRLGTSLGAIKLRFGFGVEDLNTGSSLRKLALDALLELLSWLCWLRSLVDSPSSDLVFSE